MKTLVPALTRVELFCTFQLEGNTRPWSIFDSIHPTYEHCDTTTNDKNNDDLGKFGDHSVPGG